MDPQDYRALGERFDGQYLARRMRAQVDHALMTRGQGVGGRHYENLVLVIRALAVLLRATGLHRLAVRNALALTVTERSVVLMSLPPAFEGLRVLHLSDLHLDGYAGFGSRIATALQGYPFDVALLTGDYRFRTEGSPIQQTIEMEALVPALACRHGAYGILGNHDSIEGVLALERAGVRMLVNESVALRQGDARLWLVGVDDAHYYGLHDIPRALAGIPEHEMRVLMVHSPEIIEQAVAHGFAMYLTGHTHGGQFCLPGGFAPYVNARCPRRYIRGAWRVGTMEGYTSAGVGASGVFGRFFCPPEIVIHRLTAGQPASTQGDPGSA